MGVCQRLFVPGGSTGNYQFRGSFSFGCAKSIGFAILNFRFVDPIEFIGYLCFNFQDWVILPFRQKSSAHKYPCFRETGRNMYCVGEDV